jgi:hypothetical protein
MGVKGFAFSLILVTAIAALTTAALASAPNLSGQWTIEQSGLNGTSSSVVTLTQNGSAVVGSNAKNGNGFTGTFVSDSKLNGTWKGPGGAGWLTVYASPNGHSFNGTWGYNGKKANGSFVGNKVMPPAPITAAGSWIVVGVGTDVAFAGKMHCTQSGPTVICVVGNATISGKYRTKDKVRATWSGPNGNGWFSFWFNDDNQSFNGIWGMGADTTPPMGRVVAQRAPSSH